VKLPVEVFDVAKFVVAARRIELCAFCCSGGFAYAVLEREDSARKKCVGDLFKSIEWPVLERRCTQRGGFFLDLASPKLPLSRVHSPSDGPQVVVPIFQLERIARVR